MKIIIIFLALIMFNGVAFSDVHCLNFQKGIKNNKGDKFLNFFSISIDYLGKTPLYSAAFDLNDDGQDEYFYYVEIPTFCGIQTGCSINLFEYIDGDFKPLFEFGFNTFEQFDPENSNDYNYFCVKNSVTHGWHDLVIRGRGTYSYDGTFYIYKK